MAAVVKTCPVELRQTPAGPLIAVGVASVSEPLQVTVIWRTPFAQAPAAHTGFPIGVTKQA